VEVERELPSRRASLSNCLKQLLLKHWKLFGSM
jgi:hypothetical protein